MWRDLELVQQASGGTLVEHLSIKLKVQGSKPGCGGLPVRSGRLPYYDPCHEFNTFKLRLGSSVGARSQRIAN